MWTASVLIAKNGKTGHTNAKFNSLSTGGAIESLSDAEDQANEAKNQKAARWNSQASEETEEETRQDSQCGRREKGTTLARLVEIRSRRGFLLADQCWPGASPPLFLEPSPEIVLFPGRNREDTAPSLHLR
jgi:hypothetical protein